MGRNASGGTMKNVLAVLAVLGFFGVANAAELVLSNDGGQHYFSFGTIAKIELSSKGLKLSYADTTYEPSSCLISPELARKNGTDLANLAKLISDSSPTVICTVSREGEGPYVNDSYEMILSR
jgi:hypothetical protein